MLKRLSYIVGVLLLLAGVWVLRPSHAAADNQDLIVYMGSTSEQGPIISSVRADGTDYRTYGHGVNPQLSPDGTKIAYLRTTDAVVQNVFVVDVDGTNEVNLTNNTLPNTAVPRLSWTPDGTKIVFSSNSEELETSGYPTDLYSVTVDGGVVTNLTPNTPGESDDSPVLSPDGTKILYQARYVSNGGCLAIMYADGTSPHCVYANSAQYPSWAPDSAHFVFEARWDGADGSRLVVANAGGGDLTPITPQSRNDDIGVSIYPQWSPDGSLISFQYGRCGCNATGEAVATVQPNGDNEHIVTSAALTEYPSWSPDSSALLFTNQSQLLTVPAGGGVVQTVLTDSHSFMIPKWGSMPRVIPEDTNPPAISYTLTPAASALGWNKSAVTVNFVCADDVSVASCTSPVIFSEEGANQAVTGTVKDVGGHTASTTVTVNIDTGIPTIGAPSVSASPIATSQSSVLTATAADGLSGVAGGEYYLGGTDPGLGNGLPMTWDGANLNATLSSLPPATYAITVRAKDAADNWSDTATTSLVVTPDDEAPAFTSDASKTLGVRTPFDFAVTTTGYPTPVITESGALPDGVTFTDNGDGTAHIAGMVPVGGGGTFPLTLAAANGVGSSAAQSFTLVITATSVPTITSSDADTESYGVPFSFTVTTGGYPVSKLTKTGVLPAGVTFVDNHDGTATISGTPANAAAGAYPLTIKAKSTAGTATQLLTLTIARVPAFKNISGQSLIATVGTPYSLVVKTTGFSPPTVGQTGQLPDGITYVDNGDGTATISGVPAPQSGATYPITLVAANQDGTTTKDVTLTVKEVPVFISPSQVNANENVQSSFQVSAYGFPVPKYTLTGTLPRGVTFKASTGVLSGMPRTGTAGSYPLTITAKNSAGTTTQSIVLDVSDSPPQ